MLNKRQLFLVGLVLVIILAVSLFFLFPGVRFFFAKLNPFAASLVSFDQKDNDLEVLKPEEKLTILDKEPDSFLEKKNSMEEELAQLPEATENKSIKEKLKEEVNKEENKKEKKQVENVKAVSCEIAGAGSPSPNKVVLNEIAWMGTRSSANDEWVELKNISNEKINLANWQIFNKNLSIKIKLAGTIEKKGFYLLERTNDDSVPGISSDLIYNGAIRNSDEGIYLFDDKCKLQDSAEASPDWSFGDNTSKRTMERKLDLTWQTSSQEGGTPKRENSDGYSPPPALPGGSEGSGEGEGASPPSYPLILISEVQIAPTGDRFVELYNPNSDSVTLTDWYLQRKTETGTSWNSLITSTQFEGKIIQAQGHFLIARSQTFNPDIFLSNMTLTDGNTIRLRNPNQETVDLLGWGQAQEPESASSLNPLSGKSIGRKWNEASQNYQDTNNNSTDFEIQNPTPKTKNQSPPFPPNLTVSPPSFNFQAHVNGENPLNQFFTIGNTGARDLNWSFSVSENDSWLGVLPISGIIQPNDSVQAEVSVNISGMTEGSYQASITVQGRDSENNQAQNSPQNVSVNLTIAP